MKTLIHSRRVLRVIGTLRKASRGLSETALLEEWRAVDGVRSLKERDLARVARRLFREQEADVLKALPDALEGISKAVKRELIVRRIFDLAFWKDLTERLFRPLIEASSGDGWGAGFLRVGVTAPSFSSDLPVVRRSINDLVMKTKGINDTTASDLSRLIDEGLRDGKSQSEIAQAIAAQFEEYRGPRARLIAETTSVAAFESGQQAAFEEAGITRKRWLAQRDGRVRTSHAEADGQEVAVNEPFQVGGHFLLYPGDATGGAPARETVRCRCTSLPLL